MLKVNIWKLVIKVELIKKMLEYRNHRLELMDIKQLLSIEFNNIRTIKNLISEIRGNMVIEKKKFIIIMRDHLLIGKFNYNQVE